MLVLVAHHQRRQGLGHFDRAGRRGPRLAAQDGVVLDAAARAQLHARVDHRMVPDAAPRPQPCARLDHHAVAQRHTLRRSRPTSEPRENSQLTLSSCYYLKNVDLHPAGSVRRPAQAGCVRGGLGQETGPSESSSEFLSVPLSSLSSSPAPPAPHPAPTSAALLPAPAAPARRCGHRSAASGR